MTNSIFSRIMSFLIGRQYSTLLTRKPGFQERSLLVNNSLTRFFVDDPKDVFNDIMGFCDHFGRQMIVTEIKAHDGVGSGGTQFYILDGNGLKLTAWVNEPPSCHPFLNITDSEGNYWMLALLKDQWTEALKPGHEQRPDFLLDVSIPDSFP